MFTRRRPRKVSSYIDCQTSRHEGFPLFSVTSFCRRIIRKWKANATACTLFEILGGRFARTRRRGDGRCAAQSHDLARWALPSFGVLQYFRYRMARGKEETGRDYGWSEARMTRPAENHCELALNLYRKVKACFTVYRDRDSDSNSNSGSRLNLRCTVNL